MTSSSQEVTSPASSSSSSVTMAATPQTTAFTSQAAALSTPLTTLPSSTPLAAEHSPSQLAAAVHQQSNESPSGFSQESNQGFPTTVPYQKGPFQPLSPLQPLHIPRTEPLPGRTDSLAKHSISSILQTADVPSGGQDGKSDGIPGVQTRKEFFCKDGGKLSDSLTSPHGVHALASEIAARQIEQIQSSLKENRNIYPMDYSTRTSEMQGSTPVQVSLPPLVGVQGPTHQPSSFISSSSEKPIIAVASSTVPSHTIGGGYNSLSFMSLLKADTESTSEILRSDYQMVRGGLDTPTSNKASHIGGPASTYQEGYYTPPHEDRISSVNIIKAADSTQPPVVIKKARSASPTYSGPIRDNAVIDNAVKWAAVLHSRERARTPNREVPGKGGSILEKQLRANLGMDIVNKSESGKSKPSALSILETQLRQHKVTGQAGSCDPATPQKQVPKTSNENLLRLLSSHSGSEEPHGNGNWTQMERSGCVSDRGSSRVMDQVSGRLSSDTESETETKEV